MARARDTARLRRTLIATFALVANLTLHPAARADSGPVEGCRKGSETSGFWERLSRSYETHLFAADAAATTTEPAPPFDAESAGYRQDLPPPPVSNPPWPYGVWNEGAPS